MIFLFLEKPFKKDTDLRTFYFLPHGCRTQACKGCKHGVTLFLTSSHNTWTFYYRITYLLFFTIATFPGLLVMETEKGKKTVNTTNLRQPRRLLMLNLLKTCPSSSPHQSAFPHFCALFFFFFPLQVKSCYSESGLFVCGL